MIKDKLKLEKNDLGRPSDYSFELSEEICLRLSYGEGLVKICKDPLMPHRSTVIRWIAKHPDFCDRYALAREAQADYLLEELIDIADDKENDTYEDAKGNIRVDHENVNRSRLRVDTRKWVISKLAPKKYGDRVDLATTDHNWTVNGIPIKT
jgi:hypothetical protein